MYLLVFALLVWSEVWVVVCALRALIVHYVSFFIVVTWSISVTWQWWLFIAIASLLSSHNIFDLEM
jgi:hypothetical protein